MTIQELHDWLKEDAARVYDKAIASRDAGEQELYTILYGKSCGLDRAAQKVKAEMIGLKLEDIPY